MDQDFLAELDVAFSNVGSDLLWRRNIGGVELWISPIQFSGQEKVVEAVSKMDLGGNIINESKRITLSYAIVGVGDHDLREYRKGQAVFPIPNKEGKTVKTTLEKYLYHKLGSWGFEFTNNVFLVYADLMETYEKSNLKDIKFDNAKDLREELADLQARVYELRQQLNMPPLVEGAEPADDEISKNEGLETFENETETETETDEKVLVPFDPFSVTPQPVRQSKPTVEPRPPIDANLQQQPELPSPSSEAVQRARDLAEIDGSFPNQTPPTVVVEPSVVQPVIQSQSIRNDVLDKQASREPVSPPVIDKINVSRNPRFRPPGRV